MVMVILGIFIAATSITRLAGPPLSRSVHPAPPHHPLALSGGAARSSSPTQRIRLFPGKYPIRPHTGHALSPPPASNYEPDNRYTVPHGFRLQLETVQLHTSMIHVHIYRYRCRQRGAEPSGLVARSDYGAMGELGFFFVSNAPSHALRRTYSYPQLSFFFAFKKSQIIQGIYSTPGEDMMVGLVYPQARTESLGRVMSGTPLPGDGCV